MKLYLGLLESSRPDQTRIFTKIDGRLIDVNLAYAAYLQQSPNNPVSAYELADFYFPETIAVFLERGEPARKALAELTAFVRRDGDLDNGIIIHEYGHGISSRQGRDRHSIGCGNIVAGRHRYSQSVRRQIVRG